MFCRNTCAQPYAYLIMASSADQGRASLKALEIYLGFVVGPGWTGDIWFMPVGTEWARVSVVED